MPEILQFLLPPQPPLVFTARSCEALSSWPWNPGLHSLVWGWDCWLPRYPSQFLSNTQNFYQFYECGSACSATAVSPCRIPSSLHGHLVSAPPTHLDECGFFKTLVVRGVCIEVSCDSSCGCARRWSMSTYASILTRSPFCFSKPSNIYRLCHNVTTHWMNNPNFDANALILVSC